MELATSLSRDLRLTKHPQEAMLIQRLLANPCGDFSFCAWTTNSVCAQDDGSFHAGKLCHWLVVDWTNRTNVSRILPRTFLLRVLQVLISSHLQSLAKVLTFILTICGFLIRVWVDSDG